MSGFDVDLLPSKAEIANRVAERFNDLISLNANSESLFPVCCICDRFILVRSNVHLVNLKTMREMKVHLSWTNIEDQRRAQDIEKFYSFQMSRQPHAEGAREHNMSFLEGMALSPRGTWRRGSRRNRNSGFTVCPRCHSCCRRRAIPRHAIVNKNYCGVAPQFIQDLNEIELAFISPVKSYGWCFTWQGGMELRGTLAFMRVEKSEIASAVSHLNVFGLNQHVVVLFIGKMTSQQLSRAKERSKIRTNKIIDAVEWLVENNCRWKDVDLEKIKESLESITPCIVERCDVDTSVQQSNVEQREMFTCYFPEGQMTPEAGGLESSEVFKEYVEEMTRKGFDV